MSKTTAKKVSKADVDEVMYRLDENLNAFANIMGESSEGFFGLHVRLLDEQTVLIVPGKISLD